MSTFLMKLTIASVIACLAFAGFAFADTQSANIGQSATIGVTINGGTSPFTYQWMKNGVAITGATLATYTITSVTATDAATYTVKVSNSAGSVVSDNALLTVITAPASATTKITIGLSMGSTSTPSFQWKKSGKNIVGETGPILMASIDPTAAYSLLVSFPRSAK